ncbi:hypothetical protein SEA_BRUHMOMENT_106 [Arthrobacter phage BruhMoment]|nr:hypothetical protein SEA_BRUHMOMENT_106 [Arthrobacter phage BruhMoment]
MSGPPTWLVMIGAAGNLLAAHVFFTQHQSVCLLFAAGLGINLTTIFRRFTEGGRTTDPQKRDSP